MMAKKDTSAGGWFCLVGVQTTVRWRYSYFLFPGFSSDVLAVRFFFFL